MEDKKPTNDQRPDERAVNRRRLLKIAIATAPVIATLPSGAALARSSNVISATASADGAKDILGRTLCLDETSGSGPVAGGVDVGQPPSGQVAAIVDRDYRNDDRGSATRVTEEEMCRTGGDYYYLDSGWNKVTVPKGILVSAIAVASLAGGIIVNEI